MNFSTQQKNRKLSNCPGIFTSYTWRADLQLEVVMSRVRGQYQRYCRLVFRWVRNTQHGIMFTNSNFAGLPLAPGGGKAQTHTVKSFHRNRIYTHQTHIVISLKNWFISSQNGFLWLFVTLRYTFSFLFLSIFFFLLFPLQPVRALEHTAASWTIQNGFEYKQTHTHRYNVEKDLAKVLFTFLPFGVSFIHTPNIHNTYF